MAIVGARSYRDKYAKPKRPEDLLRHNCPTLPKTHACWAGGNTGRKSVEYFE
jgi:hypothetical protein